jgi:selenocysteine-specific elongation factor
MFVLGTAGHVDHGKSSFLRVLTGQEPDRLPEEKKRGMTIDLNFVSLATASGAKAGIVDVPGHHRFVKNMISGVMSIDAFLFIVAADDGWMPQSQEHLEVLKGLGVRRGLGILTKTDLADEEWITEMEKEFRAKLASAFGPIDIRRFSVLQPETIVPIRREIEKLLGALPPPRDIDAARLWVDRVFLPKGQGVVVTGTLREGSLREGDALQLLPAGQTAIVKHLQAYHLPAPEVGPVSRVALQLSRVQSTDVARGMLLQKNRTVPVTRRLDARVDYFDKPVERATELAFHLGTCRVPVLVVQMGTPQGDQGWVRLKLKHPVPVRAGDRFVLRTPGEEFSIAAGVVADPSPIGMSHRRALQRLAVWEPSASGWITYALKKGPLVDLRKLADESIYSTVELKAGMLSLGSFQALPMDRYIETLAWQKAKETVTTLIFQAYSRTREELSEAELAKALQASQGWRPDLARLLFDELLRQGALKRRGKGYLLSHLEPLLDPAEAAAREKIGAWLSHGGGQPVPLRELGAEESKLKKVVWAMVKEGTLLSLGDDHFVEAETYRKDAEKVAAYLKEKGQATTSALREFLQTSRKNAVLLLERMDEDRLTYLKDGVRRLLR